MIDASPESRSKLQNDFFFERGSTKSLERIIALESGEGKKLAVVKDSVRCHCSRAHHSCRRKNLMTIKKCYLSFPTTTEALDGSGGKVSISDSEDRSFESRSHQISTSVWDWCPEIYCHEAIDLCHVCVAWKFEIGIRSLVPSSSIPEHSSNLRN
ncbi:hypothetical protein AVEN_252923-1 [Araneus ventricosus]|uniref:Uncharacterized protein n=1 Tax=Araneus ventricosus TaxID=182803 RepID=A0A4Y2FE21_ARAVE|nr:hypothetical protein AVEN_252923-1 [Araneus ventricosus]